MNPAMIFKKEQHWLTLLALLTLVALFAATPAVQAQSYRECPPPWDAANYGSPLNLSKCNLDFIGDGLSSANLIDANISEATMWEVNLSGADLSGANLTQTDLILANLTNADLSNATLHRTAMYGTDLRGADLTGATLTSATLPDVKLNGTDLTGANLTDADLSGANLTNANLTNANLSSANLDGATNLSGVIWSNTTCPDGSNSSANNPETCFPEPSDTTPPVITPNVSGAMGSNGWYLGDVTISWTVSDDESTVSSTTGCETTTINSDTSGITLTCEATSEGGTNSASVTIKRDTTAPIVNVTGVSNGATYILGSVPTVGCDTQDALSGVAKTATLLLSGGNPDGTGNFTADCVKAIDKAGNTRSFVSVTYTVLTPQEATTNIEDEIAGLVDDGVLKNGQANGLTQPLNNAIRSLDKGKTADACNQLQDFISEVNAETPDPLDAATAAGLITDAEAIQAAIGCE